MHNITGFGRTGLGGITPSMRIDTMRNMRGGIDAARNMHGGIDTAHHMCRGIDSAAVEVTRMDSVRLWPSTFANMMCNITKR